jgi:hypothetical protein
LASASACASGILAIVQKHFFGTFILALTKFRTFVTYRSEALEDRRIRNSGRRGHVCDHRDVLTPPFRARAAARMLLEKSIPFGPRSARPLAIPRSLEKAWLCPSRAAGNEKARPGAAKEDGT